MIHSRHAADLHMAQGTHRLASTEGLFDSLADALADRVPRMSCPPVDGRAPLRGVLGHVRDGIAAAQRGDEVGGIVVAIGTHCHAVIPEQAGDHVHGGRVFSRAAGRGFSQQQAFKERSLHVLQVEDPPKSNEK